jgi:hypothetical protein
MLGAGIAVIATCLKPVTRMHTGTFDYVDGAFLLFLLVGISSCYLALRDLASHGHYLRRSNVLQLCAAVIIALSVAWLIAYPVLRGLSNITF